MSYLSLIFLFFLFFKKKKFNVDGKEKSYHMLVIKWKSDTK